MDGGGVLSYIRTIFYYFRIEIELLTLQLNKFIKYFLKFLQFIKQKELKHWESSFRNEMDGT